MNDIRIDFSRIYNDADKQRSFENHITSKVKEISGVDVDPTFARPDYDSYIRSKIWQAFRVKRIAEHDGKCYMCGLDKDIRVHHITYSNLGNEYADDTIALCQDCHKRVHDFVDSIGNAICSIKSLIKEQKEQLEQLRQKQRNDMDELIRSFIPDIQESVRANIPNVIAGHKPKIARVLGDTALRDVINRACPVNKEIIQFLKKK